MIGALAFILSFSLAHADSSLVAGVPVQPLSQLPRSPYKTKEVYSPKSPLLDHKILIVGTLEAAEYLTKDPQAHFQIQDGVKIARGMLTYIKPDDRIQIVFQQTMPGPIAKVPGDNAYRAEVAFKDWTSGEMSPDQGREFVKQLANHFSRVIRILVVILPKNSEAKSPHQSPK